MLGTLDTWLMRHSTHRSSDPVYYIEDCRISRRTTPAQNVIYFTKTQMDKKMKADSMP